LTLPSAVYGSGPLSFVWTLNGNPLTDGLPATGNPGDASVVSGSQMATLIVTGVSTNEAGTYVLTVTSGASGLPYNTTNASVAVAIQPVRAVSTAYLRSLEDTNTWQVTDTTSLFAISNAVVTVYTNLTGGTTASYYIQDATGGLDLFVTGDSTFRPQMGDIVAACGTLSMYNNALELDITAGNPNEFYTVTSNTNLLLPAPVVLSLPETNNASLMETNFEGRIGMLTNVWFTIVPSIGTSYLNTYVTNAGGGAAFNVYFPSYDQDLWNQTLTTRFAYTVTGVLTQYKSGGYGPSGYELDVTRIGDVQTNPPPSVTDLTATTSGNNVVLKWTAVPYTLATRGAYSYTVLAATNVTGPYLPLTSLAFNTTAGMYTHTNALLSTQTFYRISSP